MAIDLVNSGDLVILVSIDNTLKDYFEYSKIEKEKLLKPMKNHIFKVEARCNDLKKCIINKIVVRYEDLDICNRNHLQPKGGKFDVENLVL